jgi:hypothetical protein
MALYPVFSLRPVDCRQGADPGKLIATNACKGCFIRLVYEQSPCKRKAWKQGAEVWEENGGNYRADKRSMSFIQMLAVIKNEK